MPAALNGADMQSTLLKPLSLDDSVKLIAPHLTEKFSSPNIKIITLMTNIAFTDSHRGARWPERQPKEEGIHGLNSVGRNGDTVGRVPFHKFSVQQASKFRSARV